MPGTVPGRRYSSEQGRQQSYLQNCCFPGTETDKNRTAGSVVLYFSGDKCYGKPKAGERGRGREEATEILTSLVGRFL